MPASDALSPRRRKLLEKQSLMMALLGERERIAMDLHDGVLQSLHGILLGLTAHIGGRADQDDQTKLLRQTAAQLRAAIHEIHDYVRVLRPSQRYRSLRGGLRALGAELSLNGLVRATIELERGADRGLPMPVVANALQIAHEAAANVIRHAQATDMQVSLRRQGSMLALTIRDNGVGSNPRRTGRRLRDGLRNMRERAAALGGGLEIVSAPGAGTEVRLLFPANSSGVRSISPDVEDPLAS
ncbi:MAG TPA: ATP-binding protein [Chloroflexota bacterium]